MTITNPPTCLHHLWGADDGLMCDREPGHPPGHSYAGTYAPHGQEGGDQ